MTTDRQLQANRANALQSTGPRTVDGKAASSLNAIKHGAYGSKPVAIPRGRLAEDPDAVQAYYVEIVDSLKPRDALEDAAAFRIAMLHLRFRRIERFEAESLAGDGEEGRRFTVPLGPMETAGNLALQTLDQVVVLDGRTGQALSRAYAEYAYLRARPLDQLIDIREIWGNEPNCDAAPLLTTESDQAQSG
jgi:hypothetical protein